MSPAASARRIRIRMYNVGFGDSFLVTIPAPQRPRKILIDCGSHTAGPPPRPTKEVVQQIIKDVTERGGPRIDVVVATHRHRDHVSAFGNALWSTVRVDEVWMPWTEDYDDPKARQILERQSKAAMALFLALRRLRLSGEVMALAKNSLRSAKAMATLHEGFLPPKARRRYLPAVLVPPSSGSAGSFERTFETDPLPGVRVHVLGPSRDPEVIRDMEPDVGESYLRMAPSNGANPGARPPFREQWWLPPDAVRDEPRLAHLKLEPRLERRIAAVAAENPLAVAVSLDKAVNGTSLLLVFEIGKAFLLFPGDAQWGTWQAALKDPGWAALLARTTFYKVGHHGSHNATPPGFVDLLPGHDLWCMVSTRKTAIERWDDIPREPLLDALRRKKRHRVVRSDLPRPDDHADFKRQGDMYTDVFVPF
jgi:beta-lactamase superfamily II metal-dependent hydrolase